METADTKTPRHTFLPFVVLVTSGGLSDVANFMTRIAIAWFVLQTTGSAAQTGIVFSVTSLAPIIAGGLGGTLLDRVGYRRTAILSDIASGTTLAMVPLLYLTIGLEFWQLLLLMFLGAVLDHGAGLSRNSLTPDVARLANLRLERANSVLQFVDNGSGLIAPALAGVLIAVIGSTNVLWLTATLFGVSALLMAAGMLIAGVMLEIVDLRVAILVQMLAVLAVSLSLLLSPFLHHMQAPAQSESPQTSG